MKKLKNKIINYKTDPDNLSNTNKNRINYVLYFLWLGQFYPQNIHNLQRQIHHEVFPFNSQIFFETTQSENFLNFCNVVQEPQLVQDPIKK